MWYEYSRDQYEILYVCIWLLFLGYINDYIINYKIIQAFINQIEYLTITLPIIFIKIDHCQIEYLFDQSKILTDQQKHGKEKFSQNDSKAQGMGWKT